MTRKPRGLRPEEKKLWKQIAETATHIPRAAAPTNLRIAKNIEPNQSHTRIFPPEYRVGGEVIPEINQIWRPESKPVRMDYKKFSKMKRGKTTPESRIDLHGMTAAAAHMALTAHLLRAHNEGKRLVLVITGKGNAIDDDDPVPKRTGVLRQHLPHWLTAPPLKFVVLEWTSAHQRHGGSGAFYVYLSRR